MSKEHDEIMKLVNDVSITYGKAFVPMHQMQSVGDPVNFAGLKRYYINQALERLGSEVSKSECVTCRTKDAEATDGYMRSLNIETSVVVLNVHDWEKIKKFIKNCGDEK